ncbi:MAG: TraR/DksA family transcriptional regulator [Alphaproteobacteria bacterium]
MTDQDQARALLAARRAELLALIEGTVGDSAPVELDQTTVGRLSRMDALQGQAMAQETARRRGLELQRIDAALARVDAGDYGYCVRCDEPIEPGRLKVDPATPTCVACAS